MFEPDGKKRDKQEFIEVQKAMLDEATWVVEGCSFSTFEMRFAKADVLIYFHFSRLACFLRLFKRLFNYKRDFGGLRAVTWEIVKYTWNFDKEKRARIEELKKKYPQTEFIRPLSKLHLVAKIAIFGIFSAKFFDHVYIHALKIFQKICIKVANFIKQSEFRKRSIIFRSQKDADFFLKSMSQ